jgi:hypothetical protein
MNEALPPPHALVLMPRRKWLCPTFQERGNYKSLEMTSRQVGGLCSTSFREIAGRSGLEVVKVYKDHGISGAKGRDKRPGFDALCRDATKRQFDEVMAWSVDRLGRSLQDLASYPS